MNRLRMTTIAVLALAAATGQAWAGWTMYYDGFAYEPPSTAADYKYGTDILYPYHVGDPTYFLNSPSGPYPPSAWIGCPSGHQGYWPFIYDDNFSYPGLPASTGHVVVCYGSASNNGNSSRVSLIDLNQTPPTGPYRTVFRGKLFYSVMLKVIEAPRAITAELGKGMFHAGFNELPPDPTLPTPSLTRASARIRLRSGSTTLDNTFQVGIESDTGDGSTIVWDSDNTYTSGVGSTPLFVVVSYEFIDGTTTDDVSSMWVNPDTGTLGAATPPTYTTGATSFPLTSTGADIHLNQIASFFLREGGNSQGVPGGVQRVVFDEVRIGTSWADVTSDVPCTPPTVTNISPSSGLPGEQLLGVAITGADFVQGVTQVWLKSTGLPDIQGNNVDVADPQHLVCKFNIPETAENGLRDVVVITCPESPGTLASGFGVGVAVCNNPRFDSDGDGDVDQVDFGMFQSCITTGTGGPFTPECQCMNANEDTTIDGSDLYYFIACASGPDVLADDTCDDALPVP